MAALLIVIIALVGGYYVGQFSTQEEQAISTTTYTTTLTETVTTTQFSDAETVIRSVGVDEDFMLQMDLDKVNYRLDESIIIKFNLNYTGESTLNAEIPYGGFRIKVWNETHSLVGSITALQAYVSFTFSDGKGITGNAVITGRYVSLDVNGQGGAGGIIISLSQGSKYYIEGSVGFKVSGTWRSITVPSITFSITD